MIKSVADTFVEAGLKDLALKQLNKECYSRPYCYNDVDMLVVGMYDKGNVALGGCTDEEYKTHFSLWAMMDSPLMIGSDIRKMNDATKNILTNTGIIEINQDIEGRQAYTIPQMNITCQNKEHAFVRVSKKPLMGDSQVVPKILASNTISKLVYWEQLLI